MNLAKRIKIDTRIFFLNRQIRFLTMRKKFPSRFENHPDVTEGVIDLMITELEKKIEDLESEKNG